MARHTEDVRCMPVERLVQYPDVARSCTGEDSRLIGSDSPGSVQQAVREKPRTPLDRDWAEGNDGNDTDFVSTSPSDCAWAMKHQITSRLLGAVVELQACDMPFVCN
ncbi:uncharacterized protein B0H18DRAFT_950881 [Fomitopsis serialis]|uniref:uncharacterized protein n=1 Tax=Fomitopsis serialis TaxID=139415 RepID=UPI00200883F6|nr:uncharacterized protein B0H18DRAFT_950881 [Neoantrodia serialis]KAH9935273.1 hypothetical protein B0H18DRAFT_950881 [Neoantrodia serialis]